MIDGDEVYQHIYRQERWDKSALTRCAPQSTPLRLPLRHNRPLPAPSRLLPPLTSPSRALATLAKLTSVTEITGCWYEERKLFGRSASSAHPRYCGIIRQDASSRRQKGFEVFRSFQATGLAETCWGVAVGDCNRDPKGARTASADWNQGQCEAKPNPSQN